MPEYRAYVIAQEGHFKKITRLECADDASAIKAVKLLFDGKDNVELCQSDRRVASFERV